MVEEIMMSVSGGRLGRKYSLLTLSLEDSARTEPPSLPATQTTTSTMPLNQEQEIVNLKALRELSNSQVHRNLLSHFSSCNPEQSVCTWHQSVALLTAFLLFIYIYIYCDKTHGAAAQTCLCG